ncbi:DUF6702 family protein [Ningiella sp. W23]|uniref:DUF6702 family protein n=1 Tax=Ningiella sp. W23 TaxID=3023715 RepID=UPI0037569528
MIRKNVIRAVAMTFALALTQCLLLSTIGHAHQQKAAITTILFNERTSNIEVMHRFILHDAEHAVKRLFSAHADIYRSIATQQQFMDYVIERFSLTDSAGNDIALEAVGFEVDGKHMWVYQEAPQPETLDGLRVEHNALREIWPKQTNTVNIEGKGEIQTLSFSANDNAQTVVFD